MPQDAKPLDVALLVLPHASLLSVASTLDPLRTANRHAGHEAFRWRVLSPGLSAVPLTCRLALPAEPDVLSARGADVLVIVAGYRIPEVATRPLLRDVQRLGATIPVLGAVESGPWVLARAGLLDGHRATTHWEDLEDFAAAFPRVEVVPDRFVVTPTRLTAGGAGPAADMMLDLARRTLGGPVAREAAASLILSPQPAATPQRGPAAHDPRVARALAAMEAGIEAPPTMAGVAQAAGVSVRRLEGLFAAALGATPGAFFLEMRLQAARRLVADTAHPLAEVALRTGFSPATLSRAFRRRFGVAPSALRGFGTAPSALRRRP